jgi:hypothetical protein
MVDRTALREVLLGRSVAIAFTALAGLYLARQLRLQPLQIPAYLLIVAYDAIEAAPRLWRRTMRSAFRCFCISWRS